MAFTLSFSAQLFHRKVILQSWLKKKTIKTMKLTYLIQQGYLSTASQITYWGQRALMTKR